MRIARAFLFSKRTFLECSCAMLLLPFPQRAATVNFSGYNWVTKATGDSQADPGPNFWSNDPSVVNIAPDGLHLQLRAIRGHWRCAEVYLAASLGHGIYTVQIGSPLDKLDRNTVAAPLFIYAADNQELDYEYSGSGGLIPTPFNAQLVVQPYTVPGNIVRYSLPHTAQFTSQIRREANSVTYRTWNGWSDSPTPQNLIHQWTYTARNIPPVGQERVHINLWLLHGNPPVSGKGDGMMIRSFTFQPFR
jgi:hypothetical protein